MRSLFYILSALAIMGLAFWAYRVNYQTQQSQRIVRGLQSEIGALREALSVQHAEWAYLNRPERLKELADLNFDRLNLLPFDPGQFGDVSAIAYPAPRPSSTLQGEITNPIEVSGTQETKT